MIGIFNLAAAAGIRHQRGNVVFARMTRTLEAIDAHRIGTELLRLQCVSHGRALVHDLDASELEPFDVLARVAARRFHRCDAGVDDGSDIALVVQTRYWRATA